MTSDINKTDLTQFLPKAKRIRASGNVVDLKALKSSMKQQQKTVSRKLFIKVIGGLIGGIFVWMWYRLSEFQYEHENRLEFRHEKEIPMGISYFDRYYLYRNSTGVRAFLTKCTHAGCKIGKGGESVLQCNCHGSQFEAETGQPLRGPAIKPLTELDFRFDAKMEQWVVSLSAKKS